MPNASCVVVRNLCNTGLMFCTFCMTRTGSKVNMTERLRKYMSLKQLALLIH